MAGLASADVYRWVDKDGVTHFSEVPPEETTSDFIPVGKANTFRALPVPSSSPSQGSSPANGSSTQENEKVDYDCDAARTRLDTYLNMPRLLEQNEDGTTRRVPEDERQQQILQMQADIQKYCN